LNKILIYIRKLYTSRSKFNDIKVGDYITVEILPKYNFIERYIVSISTLTKTLVYNLRLQRLNMLQKYTAEVIYIDDYTGVISTNILWIKLNFNGELIENKYNQEFYNFFKYVVKLANLKERVKICLM